MHGDKKLVIALLTKTSPALLYYEGEEIKKSRVYQYPINKKIRKMVDKIIRKDFKKWLNILWKDGYLENDDIQFINT